MERDHLNKEEAEEYKNQGNAEFKANNFTKAIENYTKAIDSFPTESSYYANRAACYLSLKKYLKCIEDCNETLKYDPKHIKALKRKAKSLFLTGNIRDSISIYNQAIQYDPNDKSLKIELKEIQLIQKLIEESKQNLENKKYTDALMDIKKALSINPDLNEMKVRQIECLAKMGHRENAIQLSNITFNDLSTNPDYLYARGLALLYNGQNDVAKKTFLEGLRLDPDNIKCRTAYKKMNKQEELKDQGNIEFKARNYDDAIRYYTESIEMDHGHKSLVSVLYANRAIVLVKLKKYREAIADCDKSIEANEKYVKVPFLFISYISNTYIGLFKKR